MLTDPAAGARREAVVHYRDPAHGGDQAHRDILSFVSEDTRLLIFDVDTAGVDDAATPVRRCHIRLVGSRDRAPRADADRRPPRDREMAAVLVLRSLTPARLRSCVRAVADGGHALTPEVICSMLPGRGADGRQVMEQLTERELDVLRFLGEGETTKEIALRMSYSERTVKAIVRDVLDKLGCRTRAHAAAHAARHGVI